MQRFLLGHVRWCVCFNSASCNMYEFRQHQDDIFSTTAHLFVFRSEKKLNFTFSIGCTVFSKKLTGITVLPLKFVSVRSAASKHSFRSTIKSLFLGSKSDSNHFFAKFSIHSTSGGWKKSFKWSHWYSMSWETMKTRRIFAMHICNAFSMRRACICSSMWRNALALRSNSLLSTANKDISFAIRSMKSYTIFRNLLSSQFANFTAKAASFDVLGFSDILIVPKLWCNYFYVQLDAYFHFVDFVNTKFHHVGCHGDEMACC